MYDKIYWIIGVCLGRVLKHVSANFAAMVLARLEYMCHYVKMV